MKDLKRLEVLLDLYKTNRLSQEDTLRRMDELNFNKEDIEKLSVWYRLDRRIKKYILFKI